MKVAIDPARCSAQGFCHSLVPEVFDADQESKGVVKDADTPEAFREQALLAVHLCPEGAISVTD